MEINGKTLIGWGITPGPHFGAALSAAQAAASNGGDEQEARAAAEKHVPEPVKTIPLTPIGKVSYYKNIRQIADGDAENIAKVDETMTALMRTPTIVSGAVMPDACPTGNVGTIPVGGVVACDNAIHPGFHSADICCSVAITVLHDADPLRVLDTAQSVTHFGGGGRADRLEAPRILEQFATNQFLAGLEDFGHAHFGTQGDGNHFLFVGRLKSTGETAVVTHHGSRKPGAVLYKRGMEVAQKHTSIVSPETLKQNAWVEADSDDGRAYWEALQIIREWTKQSHFAIHDLIRRQLDVGVCGRLWNEHNFVFRRDDGRYYHGKGATPAWPGFADDADDLTLIPLNMAEPILIVRGKDASHALGFSPHGAGRNWGRKAHIRALGEHDANEVVKRETKGIDARFWCGVPDVSELPSAYKSAEAVRSQIVEFGLADIVDEVEPFGSIMAGDWLTPFLDRKRKIKIENEGRDRL